MNTKFTVLALASCIPASLLAAEGVSSDPFVSVDTSQWLCKSCPAHLGYSGEAILGLGYVSEDSFKFGDYTGLNKEGWYLIGDAEAKYRGEDADYWDLRIIDLGLDSRSVSIGGGKQGSYKLEFKYDQLPHYINDSTQTPFSGSDNLTLPPGWTTGGSTGNMPDLAASLRDKDLEVERQTYGIGLSVTPTTKWEYILRHQHQAKEGTESIGGSFLTSSAILPQPIDYETDLLEVAVAYTEKKWQTKLAYHGSFFSNKKKSLTWENPYDPINGADSGRLALPPDNEAHQIALSGAYRFSDRTQASGLVAWGQMKQDDSFLPYTINTTLAPGALPRTSLDGRVDTLNVNARVSSNTTDALSWFAQYNYYDRDNKTAQADYEYVNTDTFVNGTRTNLPYSYSRGVLNLAGDYRFAKIAKVSLGLDNDQYDRTYQEVDQTDENTIWGKLTVRPIDSVDVWLRIAQSKRDGSGYQPVDEIQPPENPLMRKYNLADRDRTHFQLYAGYTPVQKLQLGFSAAYTADDYSDSQLGLTDSDGQSYTLDLSYVPTRGINLYAFASREMLESTQRGSESYSTADWSADNEDTIDTGGLGVRFDAMADRLEIGVDLTQSRSRGEIDMNTVLGKQSFPDLTTDLTSLRLYANYLLRENLKLRFGFIHEEYDTSDWQVDGVEPDTIGNVLSMGEESPNYSVNVFTAAVSYRF
ncbi:MAG: hypothetical protein AMJ69_10585 [Gammaproteobacteria bacterium SG8_47]|nr:MAG: hypothetical protein AMJ69_10585 [Gammaproteobacteria bacterium SG8_47]